MAKDLGRTQKQPYEWPSTKELGTMDEVMAIGHVLTDIRLRQKVLHWEAKDLMRAPYSTPRDVVRWPDRLVGPKTKVRVGYIEGSRYDDQATVASDLGVMSLSAYTDKPYGRVRYVEGRNTSFGQVRAERAKSNRRVRADGSKPDDGIVVLSTLDLLRLAGQGLSSYDDK